ncbi:hypothetical protein HOF78_03235 [Candidatus Woesearchaeota archaeon]|nr:hypothetical protein [Candidatus Woesearchaeota archaeon]
MTYGWALLVVLVAIGALAFFGVLNPGQFLPSSCTITPGIACTDFKVTAETEAGTADGTIIVNLQNGMGEGLTGVLVKWGAECYSDPVVDFPDGASLQFTLEDQSGIVGSPGCETGAVGSKIKADLTVTYISAAELTHNPVGQLVTQVE